MESTAKESLVGSWRARAIAFDADIPDLNDTQMVRKHILSGSPYILQDGVYFALREQIAVRFAIHPNEVLMVGSGKLGFSIKPIRRWKPFGDTSDIDLAIISSSLFDLYWKSVHKYVADGGWWGKCKPFLRSLLHGWIRQDLLPPAHAFTMAKDWWEFFNAISSSHEYGNIKIAAGIYRDFDFLENYQTRCIKMCRQNRLDVPA